MANPGQTIFLWLHVVANVFWIGAIAAVAIAVMASNIDPRTRGEVATTIYKRVANPAFMVSFLCGCVRLFIDGPKGLNYYFKLTHFMHGKLLFALIVIGLHHVIGARAKKLAQGDVDTAGKTGVLLAALAVCAAIAAFFVIAEIPK